MRTDTRIYKIMARRGIHSHISHSGCASHACSCDPRMLQLVTMDEVERALNQFQRELVFNMPKHLGNEFAPEESKALRKLIIGDSELED